MKLAIALDFSRSDLALNWVRQHLAKLPVELKESIVLKVGLELFTADGPGILERLEPYGYPIFLDLKLFDIPNTVEKAVFAAGRHGVQYLTVHASGGPEMLKAAQRAARTFPSLNLIGVTVLTSWSQDELQAVGIDSAVAEYALQLAQIAEKSHLSWVVASAEELPALKKQCPNLNVVTPGIRFQGQDSHDQVRVVTPQAAKERGSAMIVMGRSITEAKNPIQSIQEVFSK